MKKKLLIALVATLAAITAQGQNSLKLMTYNIRNASGMDDVRNFDRTASVINIEQPDVAAIQEVDSLTARSGKKYVLGQIANRTAMKAYFSAAIDYDGGKYGIGILSKKAPLRLSHLPLPGREENRTLLLAEFENFIFCCTHLSLTEEDRIESLKLIRELAAKSQKPFYIAGDLNALPDSRFTRELERDFTILSNPQQATYPASEPIDTIDYIAIYKHTAGDPVVTSARVLDEPMASDHRPIVVELSVAY